MVGGQQPVDRRGTRQHGGLYALELFGEQVAAGWRSDQSVAAIAMLQALQELLGQYRFILPTGGVQCQLLYHNKTMTKQSAV